MLCRKSTRKKAQLCVDGWVTDLCEPGQRALWDHHVACLLLPGGLLMQSMDSVVTVTVLIKKLKIKKQLILVLS